MTGCGDGRTPRYAFSGRVVIDGQPLETGFVRFIPESDRPATGRIGRDGRFTLTTYDDGDGAVAGTHRIEVIARQNLDNGTAIKYLTPRHYQDAATSGLSVTIDGPQSDYVVELTWNGEQPYIERTSTAGDAPIKDE